MHSAMNGIGVSHVRQIAPRMEDAFISLVSRPTRQQSPAAKREEVSPMTMGANGPADGGDIRDVAAYSVIAEGAHQAVRQLCRSGSHRLQGREGYDLRVPGAERFRKDDDHPDAAWAVAPHQRQRLGAGTGYL